jgi:thioesterase domain-containing protein
MIPTVFVPLKTLPLMPNGKVDRQALPTPEPGRAEPTHTFVAPRDQLEYQLAKVWEQGLGLTSIGVQDNFFALGGHSLLAVRLCAQMEKVLGRHVPLASMYQAPTVELLATQLRRAGWTTPPSLLLPYRPGGSKPPFFCVHGIELMGCAMPEEQPYYALHPHALDGRRAPSSIEAMAADYLKDIQTLQAHGPYFLGGASIGGMIAYEMAQQLRRQGQEVALLILIDPTSLQYQPPVSVRCRKSLTNIGRTLASMLCEWYLETGRRIPRWLCMPYFIHVGLKAGRAYIPQPYAGRVIFFRAKQSPDSLPVEWRKFVTGAWETHVIPGDHFGLFQEPHGRILAEHLAEVLHKVLSTH